MILSCHQPNFFPWKPYFEKISRADVFVLLNNVQFTRHQFQNRFYYLNSWMTMPVEKGHLSDLIKDKKYVNPDLAWDKIKNKIQNKKLNEFDSLISDHLATTNQNIIKMICNQLAISTPILEDAPTPELNASQKIVNLCLKYGASTYLAGPSGKKYLDPNIFLLSGINIVYFESDNSSPILDYL